MDYNTGDLRRGLRVELDGEPYVIVESEFMKPGKGQGIYRIKCKNLLRDRVLDKTYRSGDKIKAADVEEKAMEYSYKAGDRYVFMDMESYEQHEVPLDALGDAWKYLLEGMRADVVFWNGTDHLRRPAAARRPDRRVLRAGGEGQHRHQRAEAGDHAERLRRAGAGVHQHRRRPQDRLAQRRLRRARLEGLTAP